jgi:diamine N-acetyltransferase
VNVTLRLINDANRNAVQGLTISADQSRFVDDVRSSLVEATTYEQPPWCRAVYHGDIPVGFVMLADDDPTCPWRYFLWRLLIDVRYQGRGFGRAAVEQTAGYVRGRPGGDELVTTVALYGDVRDDASPLGFYRRCGFVNTGELHYRELVLRRPLRVLSPASS